MRVEPALVRAFSIFDAERLDTILVVLQDCGAGRGRLLIECYGNAWSTFWSAMGARTLKDFLGSCEADYIANSLWPARQRRTKHEYAYLVRIVESAQAALKLPNEDLQAWLKN